MHEKIASEILISDFSGMEGTIQINERVIDPTVNIDHP